MSDCVPVKQLYLQLIYGFTYYDFISLKDTHRKKALSSKTPVLRKSANMAVWTVGTLSQLFMRGS